MICSTDGVGGWDIKSQSWFKRSSGGPWNNAVNTIAGNFVVQSALFYHFSESFLPSGKLT